MYGVSYDDFWHLNPKKIGFYRIAYEKNTNYVAWMNGAYIRQAIGSSLSSKNKYPKEPFESNKSDDSNVKPATDAELFALYAFAVNKQFEK